MIDNEDKWYSDSHVQQVKRNDQAEDNGNRVKRIDDAKDIGNVSNQDKRLHDTNDDTQVKRLDNDETLAMTCIWPKHCRMSETVEMT